jgi:hypothetical protein
MIPPDSLRRTVIALAACLSLGVAERATAQTRPLQTEEAHTGRPGRLVLETGASFISSEPNFVTGLPRDRWDAPVFNVVYSPAANVELDLEWVARVIAVDDPRFGTTSDWGDVTLRSKVRLVDEYRSRPAVALRFGVTLPETAVDEGLGPNMLRMMMQAMASKTFSRFQVHANAGFAIQDVPLTDNLQSDFLAYGVAVGYTATEKLDVLAEVAGLVGHAHVGADQHNEIRAGVRYGGRSKLRWDLALRRGLSEADGNWGFTAGVTWVAREGK